MHLDYVLGTSIYLGLVFCPVLLLPWLWFKLSQIHPTRVGLLLAGLNTLSYAHLLSGLLLKRLLWGPDYSDRLYYTLGSQAIFCLVMTVAAVVIRPPLWLRTGSTAFATSLAWFAVYAINTVV